MENKLDLLGKKFGRWSVLSQSKSTKAGIFYLCQCDCGKQKEVLSSSLNSGKSKSCGCYNNDSKSKDLTGKKFNMLTCIERAQIIVENKVKRAWLCKCDCGNTGTFITTDIIRGRNRSCGCLRIRDHSDVLNIKFGKLIPFEVIRKERSGCNHTYYKCKCECGNIIETQANKLKSGHTSSCGCLSKKKAKKRLSDLIKSRPPENQVYFWKYKKNSNLSLNEFIKLSSQKCFYCKDGPNLKFKMNGKEFIYNELDKINNLLPHSINNSLTICRVCKRFKKFRNLNDFIVHASSLKLNFSISPINYNNLVDYVSVAEKSEISLARNIYKSLYNDGNVTFNQFFNISKLNCNYCGSPPLNKSSRKLKTRKVEFVYNGLDRLDSGKNHSIDNVVPCCKYCNWAKNNMSTDIFKKWIINLQREINNFNNSRDI